MVAVRRTLTVNCRRCGRSAERVRRANDDRSPAYLLESARCGFCYARAREGTLEIIATETGAAQPGLILEDDGELHPRSLRNGGMATDRRSFTIVTPFDPPEAAWPRVATSAQQTLSLQPSPTPIPGFWSSVASRMYDWVETAGAGIAVLMVAGLLACILAVGSMATANVFGRAFDLATSPTARERTYDFSDPLERNAYCSGREYLVNIRGANVPEDIRELRRNVMHNCPDLARLR